MPSFWQKIRADFPITKNTVYLDHASGGPVPRPVREKVTTYYQEHSEQSDFCWPKWMKQKESARESIARFINADPSEVAFTQNTSHSMNLVAELLAGKGAVLTNTSEFPSSTVPWLWRKAKMIWQEPEDFSLPVSRMKGLLKPSVKTILTSYVQYSSGFRQDLTAIGKMKAGRYFVVNATQGLGALKVDVKRWNADFLCTNSYKWMLAGYGGGILYINKKHLAKLQPTGVGWRSMRAPEKMNNRLLDLKPEASRYELGSASFPAIFAMGAAVEYLATVGVERIEKRILELTDFLIEGLEKKGFEVISPREPGSRSGIVVFKADDPQKIWKKLLTQRIYVSPRGVGIRVAPHFYNTFEEIETFLAALRK